MKVILNLVIFTEKIAADAVGRAEKRGSLVAIVAEYQGKAKDHEDQE
jgi:hypothetical protein